MEGAVGTLITVVLVLCLSVGLSSCQDDPREVPIIKQINRVNEDGTYTFGYEAADGSFKIETRDVLGNVKGMFGYIDERGELKRVSYTSANGTGYQSSGGEQPAGVTRRPVLIYRGIGSGRRTTGDDGPVTPAYGEYLTDRRRGGGSGYSVTSSTTEESPVTSSRPPVRVLVTKRPLSAELLRNQNLIRRQLERDRDDYSTARRFRYQSPGQQQPDPREVYRNQLLEQSNLKPDYPSSGSRVQTTGRDRYYPQQGSGGALPQPPAAVQEDEYGSGGGASGGDGSELQGRQPTQRYIPQSYFLPERYVAERYRTPPPPTSYYDDPYGGYPERRYPVPGFRRPPGYDSYDYETFREAMNYLIQYLQYMRRTDPYGAAAGGGAYPPPYGAAVGGGAYPPPYGAAAGGGAYPPPYGAAAGGGAYPSPYGAADGGGAYPPVGLPPLAPPLTDPYQRGRGPPLPPPLPPVYPPPGGRGRVAPLPPQLYPGYLPGPYPTPNIPYINPNVQYSSSETSQSSSSEQLSQLKSRMDQSDQSDNADTRPPTSALIRMLLARPSTQRPVVRSVEILGTASTAASVSSTTSTTEQPDLMEASS